MAWVFDAKERARGITRVTGWRRIARFGLLVAASGLAACANVRVQNDTFARQHGFEAIEVPGQGYTHVAYVKPAFGFERWHVYLEGDGLPWVARFFVNPDPAVREPLMLRLMAQDPAPTLYLGRPCYHGNATDDGCDASLWTYERHSSTVVESQVAALRRLVARFGIRRLALIGHSGGGAMAMLMAPRVPQAEAVMTVAGNLDLGAWTRLHRYSPLIGSLDPATQPPLPAGIVQLHYAGGADTNIPPELTASVVRRQPCARWTVVEDATHSGGWWSRWPGMLAALDHALEDGCANAR